jgi:hypothetical protein
MTSPTKPDFAGPCPRCGGGVPNDATPGAYPGALSRVDNATYICSTCGSDEGMFNFVNPTLPLPPLTTKVWTPATTERN